LYYLFLFFIYFFIGFSLGFIGFHLNFYLCNNPHHKQTEMPASRCRRDLLNDPDKDVQRNNFLHFAKNSKMIVLEQDGAMAKAVDAFGYPTRQVTLVNADKKKLGKKVQKKCEIACRELMDVVLEKDCDALGDDGCTMNSGSKTHGRFPMLTLKNWLSSSRRTHRKTYWLTCSRNNHYGGTVYKNWRKQGYSDEKFIQHLVESVAYYCGYDTNIRFSQTYYKSKMVSIVATLQKSKGRKGIRKPKTVDIPCYGPERNYGYIGFPPGYEFN
jgi:hypothetical protein